MVSDKSRKEGDRGSTAPGPEAPENLSRPSAVEEITSKIEVDKQYGGADVKTMVENALSADGRVQKDRAEKAEKEAKRLTGEVAGLTTQFNTVSSQVNQLLKANDEVAADKVKDDPAALSSLRARQANVAETFRLQGESAKQEARKTVQDTRDVDVSARETTVSIKLAAMAAGVDEKRLADLVPDGNPERLALAANTLKQIPVQQIDPKTGKPVVDPKTGKEIPAALTTIPASTLSTGADARSVSEKMLADAKKK